MLIKESIFLLVSVFAGFSFIVLGLYAWRREKSVRAKLFLLVLILLSINVFSYFFEIFSSNIETKYLWNKIFYTTLVAYLTIWLLFSIEFRYDRIVFSSRFRIIMALLSIVPAITIFFVWFDWNGFFHSLTGTKPVGSFSAVTKTTGFLYWVHSAYSWLLVIATTILILSKISRLGKEYRLQAIAIAVGVLTPMLYNLTYHFLIIILNILPPIAFKMTQLMYIVTAVTFTWGIFGEKFLDIVPIARRIVFDNVDDLIFVFNTENRIIDANESAHRFMKNGIISMRHRDVEGRSAADIFASNPKLLEIIEAAKDGRNEILFQRGTERIYFDVSLSGIHDKKELLIGHVAIFRDISEIRNAQEELIKNIQYASRIQNAILPSHKLFSEFCSDYFILNKPKDIVSGDFYWLTKINGKLMFTLADCTGHGVSGAFMSILGIMFLERIVSDDRTDQTTKILNSLTTKINSALRLKNNNKELKDGLELTLCVYDPIKKNIQMSGSFRYIYLIRDNVLTRIEPVSKKDDYQTETYSDECEMNISSGDILYLFTDGYPDQFGGENKKKFSSRQFQDLLKEINHFGMNEQKQILNTTIIKWKGSNEQTDDITVLGLRF